MGFRFSVLLLVSVLIAPGFFVLAQPAQHTAYSPAAGAGYMQENTLNYTIYSPIISHTLLDSLNSFAGKWGSHASVYGNLIEFSAPAAEKNYTDRYLSMQSREYGFSFFSSNGSLSFSPQLPYISGSSSATAPSAYLPSTIYSAYNYSYANSRNINGNGTTIVVIDAYGDPYLKYDLAAFDNVTKLAPVVINTVYLNKTPLQYNKSWALETAMDVEWAHASAPGARIVLVIAQNTGSGLEDAVSYAVSNRLGQVISLSWGAPESSLINQVGVSGVETLGFVYVQAYREGITVFAASGDDGAYDGTGSLAVNFPASDPYVTGVGGTSLFKYNNGYEENGWGGSNTGGTFGSGGGYSSIYSAPSWQSAPGFTGTKRGVPDVSAIADKYTGVLVIFGGNAYQAGGTSLSTPIWAGIASRMDQFSGHSLGFMNPMLYQISRTPMYKSSFNTILKGTNGHYSVTKDWNPVTGLGSPNVTGLMKSYRAMNSPYGFVISSMNSYNTTSMYASLSLNATSSQFRDNGTIYYYESFYRDHSHFLKYGIAENSSGMFIRTSIADGQKYYNASGILEAAPYSSAVLNVSLSYSGYSVILSAGGKSSSLNIFVPFLGDSVPSVGAEMLNSTTNTTEINNGVFSNIHILDSGSWQTFSSFNESHYSGVALDSNYSSISGVVSNGIVTVRKLPAQLNGVQEGTATVTPEITYTLSYRNPLEASFGLSGNQKVTVVSWSLNGKPLSGSSTVITSSGNYRITAVTTGGNISRTVYIQNTTISDITLENPLAGLQTDMLISVNHFFTTESVFTGSTTIRYTSIAGSNRLEVKGGGYRPYVANVASNTAISHTLTPLNAVLTLHVSPGIARVAAGPLLVQSVRGVYRSEVSPGPLTLNISSSGYGNYSQNLYIYPGKDMTESIQLTPLNNLTMKKVSGFVRDAAFNYGLRGVMVSIGNRTYTYTNSTGNFTIFLPSGSYTMNFSLPLYNGTTVQKNITGNLSFTVDMSGAGLNSIPYYSIIVHYAFPLLFFFLYLTWSAHSSVSKYVIYYSTSSSFNTFKKVNISGGQNYAILSILPVHTYYVQIFGYSSTGTIVSSNEVVVAGSSPLNLIINSLIFAGIVAYAVVAIRYGRRVFSRGRR